MTYRKGVDLLLEIIPSICKKYPQIHWIIGGDGEKLPEIVKTVNENGLQDRVEILGMVPSA